MEIEFKGFDLDGEICKHRVTPEEIIRALGYSFSLTSVSLILKKNENEISAGTNCVDEEMENYPGIYVTGQTSDDYLDLAQVELPNADHDDIATYLFAGRAGKETDDWIIALHDGDRQDEDESRRVVLVDQKLVAGVSVRQGLTRIPTTEQDARKEGIPLLF